MPRNMSFMLTTEQIRNKTKDVTRRLKWLFVKPGDVLNAVEKGMGLKKREKVVRICQIRVISTRLERLNKITKEDCIREGFPQMGPRDFVEMFCNHNKCEETKTVNRIVFEYLENKL
jgi:hypothetical protein